jgi:uncharacterized membrane protein
MAPLICLIVSFLFFRILGLEWRYFADWHFALRAALGAMFLLTASAHWGKRRADLTRMVPESLGNPGVWVTLTGLAEIAIAVGLQIHGVAPRVAAVAVLTLCCLFPANVKAAREHLMIQQKPFSLLDPSADSACVYRGTDRQCLAAAVNKDSLAPVFAALL